MNPKPQPNHMHLNTQSGLLNWAQQEHAWWQLHRNIPPEFKTHTNRSLCQSAMAWHPSLFFLLRAKLCTLLALAAQGGSSSRGGCGRQAASKIYYFADILPCRCASVRAWHCLPSRREWSVLACLALWHLTKSQNASAIACSSMRIILFYTTDALGFCLEFCHSSGLGCFSPSQVI